MNHKYLVLFVIFITGLKSTLFAQEEKVDNRQKLIVVPFEQGQIHTTGEFFICEESHFTVGNLGAYFRSSLKNLTAFNLNRFYPTMTLPEVENNNRNNQLNQLYKSLKYFDVEQKVVSYFKAYPFWNCVKFKKKWGTDCLSNEGQKPDKRHHIYHQALPDSVKLLAAISYRYNAAYFLFLDHFEMYTRYSNCMDMGIHVYQRDFYVHYTLVDAGGVFLDGGTIATTFQSKSNNADYIIDENFEWMSDEIIERVKKYL